MTRSENIQVKQEVELWLKIKGSSPERYEGLDDYNKKLLQRICISNFKASDLQLRKLYIKLFPGVGKDSTIAVDYISTQKLEEIFSPLTIAEKHRDPYQFAGWGCDE